MSQSGLFPQREPTGSWWRDHSLSIVLGAILFIQTIFLVWSGWAEWNAQQKAHGNPGPFSLGNPEFWIWWTYEYIVSLVADTYGVILIVLLSKWFYERGSAESSK